MRDMKEREDMGGSLIEVLVAILLISIVLLSHGYARVTANKALDTNFRSSAAMDYAASQIESYIAGDLDSLTTNTITANNVLYNGKTFDTTFIIVTSTNSSIVRLTSQVQSSKSERGGYAEVVLWASLLGSR